MKKHWWLIGLALAVVVALLSPLASPHPDGLERVAEDQAFIDRAQGAPFEVLADYMFPGIENEAVATMLAGVIGVAVVFGLSYGVGWALKRRRPSGAQTKA